jgi:DNA-binding transcriptional MocR family regulator
MPLSKLNKEQYRAATAAMGHNLIIASAGTGKTSTIVARIAHLLNSGISADKILLLTFTNKAASEMIERLEKYFDGKIKRTSPEGGLFAWCTLPESIDMLSFVNEALKLKVAVVPGTAFLPDESAKCSCFRINYSTPSDEQIVLGMEKLAQAGEKFKW